MAFRLGIDVGGTFTDVIALDAETRQLVARVKVPTTHGAAEGVAAGIIEGIDQLMRENALAPSEIVFIAHSTTQATNALLEGDVANVGVVGLLHGASWLARRQIRFPRVELAPGVWFAPQFRFARANDAAAVRDAVEALVAGGAQVLAASEAFGVDRPDAERFAATCARERSVFATSGHDVSSTYGLRARTRTAALNAAILPKMVRTARMTADAVERASIAAPLMIMRSDGGVMDVREIERRPILTLLSGPAAGIAGALLYENVTDGIFIEVGGTSSDCSAIRAGHPQLRPARVGGMRTMLRTVDSRTLGVAGGSMLRIGSDRIVDVGPRSAHIAGCRYASFLAPSDLDGATVERFAPSPHDPADYLRLALRDGSFATVTPTCASNLLGYVPADAFARGNANRGGACFDLVAAEFGSDARSFARTMLDVASAKIVACVRRVDARLRVGSGSGRARRWRRRSRGARTVRLGVERIAVSHRARCGRDLTDRRRARARPRRCRAHDRRPVPRRHRRAFAARRATASSPREPRRTESRSASRSTHNATACARPRKERPRSCSPRNATNTVRPHSARRQHDRCASTRRSLRAWS